MKCFYCRQESEWLNTKTNHVVDLKERIIIIKNVPCQECPCCGEVFYSNEVSERMDELFDKASTFSYDYVEMDYDDPTRKVYRLVKELVDEEQLARVAEDANSYGK